MSNRRPESHLGALQCHFTWDLNSYKYKLYCLRDELEDIGTEEEGYSWLGHIYNLQGFIHYQLGFTDRARSFFNRAAEAFRQMRNTISEEGPWLVVNYGNLAWLHHQQGEEGESQAYLAKVDALMEQYPSPSPDEFHPEIHAEKGWTLMKFGEDELLLAEECFRRAIRMQPDMVEWQTSNVLLLHQRFRRSNKEMQDNILEKMKIAKQHDPENLFLAACYLDACAKSRNIRDEVRELGRRVVRKPPSSYSGIRTILRLYRMYLSYDEALDLVNEALERHPHERYLKDCAAMCYKMRIFSDKKTPLNAGMVEQSISLYREVISLYPQSSLKREIALAQLFGYLQRQEEADEIFDDLLKRELDPEWAQMLYNNYAKYLYFRVNDNSKSIDYHMRAAVIPFQSEYRYRSIAMLEKIKEENKNPRSEEITKFLANLQD